MSISGYFNKVKTLCRKILELDSTTNIFESKIKRLIIYRLNPTYIGFINAVQVWLVQLSLVVLENLFIDQEALAKKISKISLKSNEEELFSH